MPVRSGSADGLNRRVDALGRPAGAWEGWDDRAGAAAAGAGTAGTISAVRIAPVKHTAAQRLHEVQSSASTIATPACTDTAPCLQASMHRPQPLQSSSSTNIIKTYINGVCIYIRTPLTANVKCLLLDAGCI
jgi:hypothetical protein